MNSQEIRKNRERIRQNVISKLVTTSQKDLTEGSSFNKIYTPQIALTKRRKTSEDIRISDDVTYMKQIYIENSFQNLFQLQQKIGEGTHSSVYKCKQLKTELIYAVKIFKHVEHESVRHLKQHYRIKKTLSHQNIVKAYYLFINEKLKKIHMICQYFPYKDLRCYMKKMKKITQSQLAQILYSTLSGIAYMHKNGVCHRDIKPQNILYNSKTGQLKIIDFQIAKMCKYTSQRLQMWTNTGTLQYKAPQMFNGSYNELIDIWAVGIIAYEIIYEKLPFQNQYLSQTIKSICQEQPNYENEQISPFLQTFLKKCLTKNPLKRMSAVETLQTPFLLKFIESSSCSSPRQRKRSGANTDQDDDKNEIFSKKDVLTQDIRKSSYNQQDLLNQKNTFSQDIGIRFLQDQ